MRKKYTNKRVWHIEPATKEAYPIKLDIIKRCGIRISKDDGSRLFVSPEDAAFIKEELNNNYKNVTRPTLAVFKSSELVAELRARGYEVTATKTIIEAL